MRQSIYSEDESDNDMDTPYGNGTQMPIATMSIHSIGISSAVETSKRPMSHEDAPVQPGRHQQFPLPSAAMGMVDSVARGKDITIPEDCKAEHERMIDSVLGLPWSIFTRTKWCKFTTRPTKILPFHTSSVASVEEAVYVPRKCQVRLSGRICCTFNLLLGLLSSVALIVCAFYYFELPGWSIATMILMIAGTSTLSAWHVSARQGAIDRILKTARVVTESLDAPLREQMMVLRPQVFQSSAIVFAVCTAGVAAIVPTFIIPALSDGLGLAGPALVGFAVCIPVCLLLSLFFSVWGVFTDCNLFFGLINTMLNAYLDKLIECQRKTKVSGMAAHNGYLDHHWAIASHFKLRNLVHQISDEYTVQLCMWTFICICAACVGIPAIVVSYPRFNAVCIVLTLLALLGGILRMVPVVKVAANIYKIRRACNDMVGNAALVRNTG
jgi:hypothetical protein